MLDYISIVNRIRIHVIFELFAYIIALIYKIIVNEYIMALCFENDLK